MRRAFFVLLLGATLVNALANCPSSGFAGWDGQVFDVTFEPPAGMMVEVTSIDVQRGAFVGVGNIELYRREGTAVGNAFSDSGWALETTVNAGPDSTTLNVPYNRVFSKPSETVGFYITGDSAEGNPSWILYDPAVPLEVSTSTSLTITAGESVTYPFVDPSLGWRLPSLCLNYVLSTLQACSGSVGSAGTPGLSFDVEVSPPSGYTARLTRLSFNQAAFSSGSTTYQLYIKENTALGEEFTPTSWTLVDTAPSIAPGAVITLTFPASTTFEDPTPKRMGVYVTATDPGSWLDTGSPTTITSADGVVSFFEGRPVIPTFGEPVVATTRIFSNACFGYELSKLEVCTSSGSGHWEGIAFDVNVALPSGREIVLESLTLLRGAQPDAGSSIEIWFNPTGGVANAYNPAGWSLLATFPAGPANQALEIPFEQVISSSSTVGLYVTGTSTGFWVDYYNPGGSPDFTSADGIVTIVAVGESVTYPFTDPNLGPRALSNSCLRYSVRSSLALCSPSGTLNWDGIAFDVDVFVGTAAVVLESITVQRADFDGGGNVLAYYNPAGASGNEGSSVGWTLITSVDGGGQQSELIVPLGIVVNADTTLGLYVTGDSAQGGVPAWLYYRSTTPGDSITDGTVTVHTGESLTYPFTPAFSDRMFSDSCLSYSIVSPTPPPTPSVTPTISGSRTTTRTPTKTRTPSGTRTSSRTPTKTRTSSPTVTPSKTSTRTQTPTPSNTRTPTRTPTVTNTGTSSTTVTPTPSQTRTPTGTVTMTGTPSYSPTGTGSVTASVSATNSGTGSPTASSSLTPTGTPTGTNTRTGTTTASSTASGTPSETSSLSAGASPLATRSPTSTGSSTGSGTATPTPSNTESQSASVTTSQSPSQSGTQSSSTSRSNTASSTASVTGTGTGTPSPTATSSTSSTHTRSSTTSDTTTNSASATPTHSTTDSSTSSLSRTPTTTLSAGATPSTTRSASKTSSITTTETSSQSSTPTPSPTETPTETPTPSVSPSSSVTQTRSGTATTSDTGTVSPTPSSSGSSSVSPSSTQSGDPTRSGTRSTSASPTPFDASSQQFSVTASVSRSKQPSALGPDASPSPRASRSFIPFGGGNGGGNDEDDDPDFGLTGNAPPGSPTPSRSITPLLGNVCTGCREIEAVHENLALWYSSEVDGDVIVVRSQDGEAVATLILNSGDVLPEDTTVNIVQAVEFPRFSVVSESVLDVTLTDSSGREVELVGDAELCFSVDADVDTEDLCLGFIDEEGRWKCEDSCLQEDNDFLCGTTDHFTSFALLLAGGENGGGDGCGSSDDGWDPLIAYLSIGIVGFFVIIVLIAVLLIELRFRYLGFASTQEFSNMSKRLAGGTASASASLATD